MEPSRNRHNGATGPCCRIGHNPVIAAFCDRLLARGKRPMQAVIAAMRRLLHLAFGVLKSGQPFNPNFGVA